MSSRVRAALLAVLLLLLLAGPAAGRAVVSPAQGSGLGPAAPSDATVPTRSGTPVLDRAAAQSAQSAPVPETTFRVALQPDGDARWTITMNFTIDSPADREAFRNLAADFGDDDLATTSVSAFRAASERASGTTGRQMSVTSVERTDTVLNDTGQLTLRFTWTNFSRQSGQTLYVDDVFNTSGTTWFPALDENQHLVIEPPPGYTIDEATPAGYAVSGGSLRWDGPRRFEPGALSASYRRVDGARVTSPGNGTGPDGAFPVGLASLFLLGLGVVALLAYVLTTRDVDVSLPAAGRATDDGGDGDGDGGSGSGPGPGDEAGDGAAVTDGASAGPADDAAEDEVDEELLSDEERIERLLERNGGRMKQANIVKETGWSNAKVSQLLSAMDEADRIDKLRIGRENLISFPDEDVTDLDEK